MRRIVVVLALASLLATGCSVGPFEDDPTATPDEGGEAVTQAPTEPEEQPTATPEATVTPTAPDPTPTMEATEPPTETAPSEATPTEAEQNGQAAGNAVEVIDEIEQDVIELRGLEAQSDTEEAIISRSELRQNLEELLAEDYSQEEADTETLVFWLLRLIDDRDLDLYQLQLDLLSEQVVGYYAPETDELFVITENEELSPGDRATIAHEIVHSLQDQHFDLAEMQDSAPDADHQTAIASLVEGDATLLMSLYVTEFFSSEEMSALLEESIPQPGDTQVIDNAPRYIRESLTFPYERGTAFVQTIYQQGGFEAVDQVFEDPPQSSEQILHPEKYLQSDQDEPMEVEAPGVSDALGSGWEETYSNTLGEWDLGIMLEENGVGDAGEAAAGWGGSDFNLYQSDEEALTVLETRWDTTEDAGEFEDALSSTFEGMEQTGDLWSDGERFFGTLASDDAVTIVSGTEQTAVEDAVSALS